MGAYCAIDKFGHVLGVGCYPDDAMANTPGHCRRDVWRVMPRTDDVLACYAAGNDVLIRIENGLAVI